ANSIDNITEIPKAQVKRHRIGLYQSWRSNMDEGWTRYVFDDLGIPYTTLHNKDFKGTKDKKEKLWLKYDVIVFADEDPDIIIQGRRGLSSRYGRSDGGFPPVYEGGIGKEGVEELKSFVEQGGILVTLNSACGLAFDEFQAPARNAIERIDRSKFFCPGSILRVNVDNKSPIGYGMPGEAAIMFYQGMAIQTQIPPEGWDRKVVARFPEDDLLLSGWLFGEDVIARKAAVVDFQNKKGHIILIGFPCQHRAQSHGTYKFLLNALLYPEVN
ncbi:MAG: peptidase M14 family protein, partial [Candidatus Aminicenantaceae bacterium]